MTRVLVRLMVDQPNLLSTHKAGACEQEMVRAAKCKKVAAWQEKGREAFQVDRAPSSWLV